MGSTRWIVFAAALFAFAACPAFAETKIGFKKKQLDTAFRSEGVAVGDFNRDGKMDIAAGSVWYAAPDWKPQPVRDQPQDFNPHGYSDSFCNFADDVNGDGWTDLVVVDFPGKETWWFENPQNSAGPWKRHMATSVTNNESPTFLNVTGDPTRELLMGVASSQADPDGPDRQISFLQRGADTTQPWTIQAISAKGAPGANRYSHGIGAGDINGDGRTDVVVPQGWWEAPADPAKSPWDFHAASLGENCAQMHVFDFDGDGDQDIASSSAHAYGVWWHEQTKEGWKTHEIDKSFSQSHSLCLADINSDGLPDLVTGKRWWAHGPTGDVGADQPAVMVWFELSRKDGQAVWTPHQFDHDSGVGTQFEVADVSGDGLLDVVTSNKKGVFYFEQVRE